MVRYKQKCSRCNKNYVLITRRTPYVVCYDCQEKELNQPIDDAKMKKFFKLPKDFYKQNAFLRNIKLNYLRYGQLSEKQTDAFIKTVKEMKAAKS